MSSTPSGLKNWFDQGGQAYARFRPEYPAELAAYLASVAVVFRRRLHQFTGLAAVCA